MINCFTYTYKTLSRKGFEFPKDFGDYSTSNLKKIIVEYKDILENEIHYDYFDSFCTRVDVAQENDIIATKDSVGIAINKLKYITIREDNKKPSLENITKDCIIFRIGKEAEDGE